MSLRNERIIGVSSNGVSIQLRILIRHAVGNHENRRRREDEPPLAGPYLATSEREEYRVALNKAIDAMQAVWRVLVKVCSRVEKGE
jgi:hypothetical protein